MAVQRLGLLAVTAEGLGTVPGQGSKILIPKADQERKKKKKKMCLAAVWLFFFLIEVTLIYNIMQVLCIQYYISTSVYGTACSPPKIQSPSITIERSRLPVFPSTTLPFDDHCSVVCVHVFVFHLVCSFILFLLLLFIRFFYIPHMSEIIWCLSFSSLGIMPSRSMLLQMARFHPFCGWVLFHCMCVYTPHLYPSVCWWTLGLFPYLDYYK